MWKFVFQYHLKEGMGVIGGWGGVKYNQSRLKET